MEAFSLLMFFLGGAFLGHYVGFGRGRKARPVSGKKTPEVTNKKRKNDWIEYTMVYVDKYAEKLVVMTTEDKPAFGFTMSRQVLEDALNGREL